MHLAAARSSTSLLTVTLSSCPLHVSLADELGGKAGSDTRGELDVDLACRGGALEGNAHRGIGRQCPAGRGDRDIGILALRGPRDALCADVREVDLGIDPLRTISGRLQRTHFEDGRADGN